MKIYIEKDKHGIVKNVYDSFKDGLEEIEIPYEGQVGEYLQDKFGCGLIDSEFKFNFKVKDGKIELLSNSEKNIFFKPEKYKPQNEINKDIFNAIDGIKKIIQSLVK